MVRKWPVAALTSWVEEEQCPCGSVICKLGPGVFLFIIKTQRTTMKINQWRGAKTRQEEKIVSHFGSEIINATTIIKNDLNMVRDRKELDTHSLFSTTRYCIVPPVVVHWNVSSLLPRVTVPAGWSGVGDDDDDDGGVLIIPSGNIAVQQL